LRSGDPRSEVANLTDASRHASEYRQADWLIRKARKECDRTTMAINIKASTRLIEIENGSEWQIERRTRGRETDWVIILKNSLGHRQFIPERRLDTLFRPEGEASAEAAP
jgi:hypothetical protein